MFKARLADLGGTLLTGSDFGKLIADEQAHRR
jgi:hypothetical protein